MKIDYTFKNESLLEKALTHPSLYKDDRLKSYERLEFFGDKVLNFILAELLFQKHPDASEASLSVMHSNLANTKCIVDVAQDIALGDFIKMELSEVRNLGKENSKVLENAMEAVIGAIYLDSDLAQTQEVVAGLWSKYIDDLETISQRDSKSMLQEWAQKHTKPIPEYTVKQKTGDSHNPVFTIEVAIQGLEPITAEGPSKKSAQQKAAAKLLNIIKNNE